MRYYNHSAELYHHGIKGQKWGIRRFQNKDGSLTKAGEKRYSEESDKKIQTNHDGSKIIPVGFKFNRVGRSTIDVNNFAPEAIPNLVFRLFFLSLAISPYPNASSNKICLFSLMLTTPEKSPMEFIYCLTIFPFINKTLP